jgi:hypothetical protein
VSVERKTNGLLRLRCDNSGCPARFIPRRPYSDARELRTRAALYGWIDLVDAGDVCPDDARPPAQGRRR